MQSNQISRLWESANFLFFSLFFLKCFLANEMMRARSFAHIHQQQQANFLVRIFFSLNLCFVTKKKQRMRHTEKASAKYQVIFLLLNYQRLADIEK